MADQLSTVGAGGDTGGIPEAGPGRGAPPGMPSWVKLLIGLVLLVVVALVVSSALGLHTLGGPGGHGP